MRIGKSGISTSVLQNSKAVKFIAMTKLNKQLKYPNQPGPRPRCEKCILTFVLRVLRMIKYSQFTCQLTEVDCACSHCQSGGGQCGNDAVPVFPVVIHTIKSILLDVGYDEIGRIRIRRR